MHCQGCCERLLKERGCRADPLRNGIRGLRAQKVEVSTQEYAIPPLAENVQAADELTSVLRISCLLCPVHSYLMRLFSVTTPVVEVVPSVVACNTL